MEGRLDLPGGQVYSEAIGSIEACVVLSAPPAGQATVTLITVGGVAESKLYTVPDLGLCILCLSTKFTEKCL